MLHATGFYSEEPPFSESTHLQAIILAAGFGKRLRPLTDKTNKCLMTVAGETILSRMVLSLHACGIREIAVVTGHCADAVMDHLAQRLPHIPVTQVHCPDYATTNNIVSLSAGLAAVAPGSDVLLIEGDLILAADLLPRFLAEPSRNLAMVEAYRQGHDGSVVRLAGATVTEIVLKNRQAGGFEHAGTFKTGNVWKFGAEFCDAQLRPRLATRIAGGDTDCFYEAVLADIITDRTHELHAFTTLPNEWVEVDDAGDLDLARYIFEPATRRAMLDSRYGGLWAFPVTDFAYPRNQHSPPAALIDALKARLGETICQYGSSQKILDAKMARLFDVPAQNTVALNGLSQVYPWLKDRFKGQSALIPAPTFGEYARAFPSAATYDPDAPIAAIAAQAARHAVVVFVNPNNPTGSWMAADTILRFAREHPDKIIVVDESFVDFAEGPSLLALAQHQAPRNLVILKSQGKALGIAGLRLGLVWTQDLDLIAGLRASLPIWNVNALAEAFLDLAPAHRDGFAASFDRTRQDRAALAAALETCPIVREVLPSAANFITVGLAIDEAELGHLLDRLLGEYGFYLRDLSGRMGRPGAWVRIAVRTATDNGKLVAALNALAANQYRVDGTNAECPAQGCQGHDRREQTVIGEQAGAEQEQRVADPDIRAHGAFQVQQNAQNAGQPSVSGHGTLR